LIPAFFRVVEISGMLVILVKLEHINPQTSFKDVRAIIKRESNGVGLKSLRKKSHVGWFDTLTCVHFVYTLANEAAELRVAEERSVRRPSVAIYITDSESVCGEEKREVTVKGDQGQTSETQSLNILKGAHWRSTCR